MKAARQMAIFSSEAIQKMTVRARSSWRNHDTRVSLVSWRNTRKAVLDRGVRKNLKVVQLRPPSYKKKCRTKQIE